MGRIRSIKPEFPQSESMGRISREARLLFIQIWTLVDDSGRARANSRMLASLLYPYDEDVFGLIDGWLSELQREGCIELYAVDGASYLEVRNWLNHQKIDKPTKSKLPPFDESSRILANPRESSATDLEGKGREGKGEDEDGKDTSSPARVVFAHWQKVMNSPRAAFDANRRRLIGARLKDGYTPEQLCQAITGCSLTAWNMGENPGGKKYNGLDLILRNAEHVDRFIGCYQNPPIQKSANKTRQERAASVIAELTGANKGAEHGRVIDVTPTEPRS